MSSTLSTFLNQILSEPAPLSAVKHDRSNKRRSQVRLAFLCQSEHRVEYTNGKRKKEDHKTARAPLLSFELLSAHWLRKVWQSYMSELGHGGLPQQLFQALGEYGRIQDRFKDLPSELRHHLYEAHLRYGMRMLLASDPAPVGIAELIASPTLLGNKHMREGDWYVVEFRDGGSLPALRQPTKLDEIVYTSIGLSRDQDGLPRRGTVSRIVPLAKKDRALHALLQALHFPQAKPPSERRVGEQGPPGNSILSIAFDKSQHFSIQLENGSFPLTFALQRDQPASTASGRAALESAMAASASHVATARSPIRLRATGAASSPAQVPKPVNPMASTESGPQPFVGVNMVGAGNNMALYGQYGIVAYVDFGAPLPVNENTAPSSAYPCVCGDPRMILSHWDYDHYAMARKVSGAWQRRWLAPQQVMGSVSARELYMRLLVSAPHGGALALWPVGAAPTHMKLPFGYVERGTGAPVNDDCLAVHVRTRDDPANAPVAAWPAIFASRSAPSRTVSPVDRRAMIVGKCANLPWVDTAALALWRNRVAIPLDALELSWLPLFTPGKACRVRLKVSTSLGSISACWISVDVSPLPAHPSGGPNRPVLPNGQPWCGGWTIAVSDFVKVGGCIVDFPPDDLGVPINNVMCVSPTPGTIWAAPTGQGAPAPGGAIWYPATSGWRPIWRGGGWMLPLPPSGAAAFAPLPAGPTSIVPTPGEAPVTANEEYILLPGDAGCQHLPSLQARKTALRKHQSVPTFVGMVATHHGSDSWIPTKVKAAMKAKAHIPMAGTPKVIYSYGTRIRGASTGAHCYVADGHGHPRPAAIDAYRAFGWGTPGAAGAYEFNRLNTAPYDFNSTQPFNPLGLSRSVNPATANSKGHYNGNVALAPGMSSTMASLVHVCPDCKQQRNYYF